MSELTALYAVFTVMGYFALANYWVYQSVHNRLDRDTVKLITWNRSEGRGFWEGTFYPTLPIFKVGLRADDGYVLRSTSDFNS